MKVAKFSVLLLVLLSAGLFFHNTSPARGATSDPQGDLLYVSSWDGNIYRIDLTTGGILVIPAGLVQPEDVAVNSKGQVYVTEVGQPHITRFEMDGSGRTVIVLPFCCPEGSSFDAQDNLFFNTNEPHTGVYRIAGGDPNNPPVQVIPPFASRGEGTTFLPNGDLLAVDIAGVIIRSSPPNFGTYTIFATTVQIIGIDADSTGRVCVTDREPVNAVECFDSGGRSLGVLATGFNVPRHAEFDSQNNFYVGNFLGNDVVKVTPRGQTSVVANIFRAHGIGIFHKPEPVKIFKFFTDTSNNPLPLDSNGNPKVDVVLANSIVRSTNPGEIIAWVNVTNTAGSLAQSLKVNETLPVDWVVAPPWLPAKGAIHVFFANTTTLSTNPEITDPKTIAVTSGNPQTVLLSIPSFNATGIGHPLLAGQSVLLAVKLDYGLDQTSQSFSSFPRNYTDVASAAVWTGVSFMGTEASATGSAFFIAYAKLLGDVNGDNKIDILDVALVAYAYGSRTGDLRWNPAADLDNDGVIDIGDVAIVAFYYGTSA